LLQNEQSGAIDELIKHEQHTYPKKG
jgi:hypothetical protein